MDGGFLWTLQHFRRLPMLCAARALSHLIYVITRMSHSLPAASRPCEWASEASVSHTRSSWSERTHHAHVSERASEASVCHTRSSWTEPTHHALWLSEWSEWKPHSEELKRAKLLVHNNTQFVHKTSDLQNWVYDTNSLRTIGHRLLSSLWPHNYTHIVSNILIM